jgi:hypothetical protein
MTPSTPLTCPRCNAVSSSVGLQTCSGCKRPFTLYTGAVVDPSAVPAPAGLKVEVKSPGTFTLRYGVVDERGVAEGMLDPVIGMLPMDTQGVAWGDIVSIAVWRSIAWVDLVCAILIPLPLTMLFLSLVLNSVYALIGVAIFGLVSWMLLHRALVVRACRARVIGRYRTVVVRFDRPQRRRRLFHDELVRRAGRTPLPLP